MFIEIFNAGNKEMSKTAYEYFIVDALDKKLRGTDRAKELSALHLEENMPGLYIPSMIYTFQYTTNYVDKLNNFEFKDVVPIIFCMGCEDDWVYGINFNLLPNNIRAKILDIIYNTDKNYYDHYLDTGDDKVKFNTKLAPTLLNFDSRIKFLQILDSLLGLKVSNAYRKYKKQQIINPRLIEFDTWQYIPFLNFTDSIRGAGLVEVQAEIIKDSNANK